MSRRFPGGLLVRLPSWLGDLVAAEPVLRALERVQAESGAERRPDRITLAGNAGLLSLFEGRFPGFERSAHGGRGSERTDDWAGHGTALLLTGSFRSAWLAWRAGIPERIGLVRHGRGWLLTGGFEPARELGRWAGLPSKPLPRAVGASYVELLALLGVPVREPRPRLFAGRETLASVERRLAALGLAPGQPFLLAAVGGRPGSAKALEPERWAALLAPLAAALDWPLVLTAGPGEAPAVAAAAGRIEALGLPPLLAFEDGVSRLPELIALCQRTALFVGTDSGPRHVARAAGAKALVLLGPMDGRHSLEFAALERRLRVPLACAPCGRERCPLVGLEERACLRNQRPEALIEAALELLHLPPPHLHSLSGHGSKA